MRGQMRSSYGLKFEGEKINQDVGCRSPARPVTVTGLGQSVVTKSHYLVSERELVGSEGGYSLRER